MSGWGFLLGGNCPGGNCPEGSCPHERTVRGGTAREELSRVGYTGHPIMLMKRVKNFTTLLGPSNMVSRVRILRPKPESGLEYRIGVLLKGLL